MPKKKAPAEPKVRFCGCDEEPLPSSPGDDVFIKSKGVLTLNRKEAAEGYSNPVGKIDASHRFVLSEYAEKALALVP